MLAGSKFGPKTEKIGKKNTGNNKSVAKHTTSALHIRNCNLILQKNNNTHVTCTIAEE